VQTNLFDFNIYSTSIKIEKIWNKLGNSEIKCSYISSVNITSTLGYIKMATT